MPHFLTERPRGDVVLASCDSTYLRRFAPSFVASCIVNYHNVHLHLMNPSYDDVLFAQNMAADITANFIEDPEGSPGLTLSAEHEAFPLAKLTHSNKRTYYACNRFLVAPEILSTANSIIISDIDAVFRKSMKSPLYNIGLFLREPLPGTVGWENEGTHVAAGLVFVRREGLGLSFIKDTANLIKKYLGEGKTWFSDQVALWETYKAYRATGVRFHVFDSHDMDWEFTPNSTMWTAKGDRKTSQAYIDEQMKYAQLWKRWKD